MMNNQGEFSIVTNNYLSRYYEILDKMIWEMTNAKLTDSISHNFIVQMVPHHKAAIEMSQNILMDTTLQPLRKIASSIIVEQTKSIKNMLNVLNSCGRIRNTERDNSLYLKRYHQITQTMFINMRNARVTNNVNANFIREMIPHHKGAIQLSENAMSFPICVELKPILQAIISSQKAGVREMENLLENIKKQGN